MKPLLLNENNQEQFTEGYLVEVQKYLENKYDVRHARKYIKDWLSDYFTEEQTEQYGKDLLNRMLDILYITLPRNKRVSINAIVEMLAEKLNSETINSSTDLTLKSIIELTKLELVVPSHDTKGRLYIECTKELTDEAIQILDELQYRLPMIVPPLKTNLKNNNKGSGYYLKQSDSLILNQNNSDIDIDSEVLDRLNQIPFQLNVDLIKNLRNSWKCMNNPTGLEEDEYLNPETKNNFLIYEKSVLKTSAILINHGNKFYLTHKYDKRGRVYPVAYQINYQGNSYAKAQIEFANKEIISDEINFF